MDGLQLCRIPWRIVECAFGIQWLGLKMPFHVEQHNNHILLCQRTISLAWGKGWCCATLTICFRHRKKHAARRDGPSGNWGAPIVAPNSAAPKDQVWLGPGTMKGAMITQKKPLCSLAYSKMDRFVLPEDLHGDYLVICSLGTRSARKPKKRCTICFYQKWDCWGS